MLYGYVFDSEDSCSRVADGDGMGKVVVMRFELFELLASSVVDPRMMFH